MPGFLYFIPTSKRAADASILREAGCAHALADKDSVTTCHVAAGPDAQSGLIVVIPEDQTNASYRPASQTWRKGPGGKYWAGFDTDQRPGPQDLARKQIYAGTDIMMAGSLWTIPRCYSLLEDRWATLPRGLDLADDGETVIVRPHPKYAAIVNEAQAFSRDWLGQANAEKFTAHREIDLAITALAVNYRIAKLEAIGLLQLMTTEELGAVLRAIIDAEATEAYFTAKLKEREPSPPAAAAA